MNQQVERLEIPNWLRSFIGAFCGGIVGGVFIYTRVGNVAWALLGFIVGCLTAYILPRPLVFVRKMKEAWKKVRPTSPKERRRMEIRFLCSVTSVWYLSCLLWIPVSALLCGMENSEGFGEAFGLAFLAMLLLSILYDGRRLNREYREIKVLARRFNFFTIPFWALWFVWWVLKLVSNLVLALPELVRAIGQVIFYCAQFLYRFTYHTFVLTSDNCRLVAVFGASLGMLYGALYQTDPLLMGVVGGSISMTVSAVSWIALRVLPLPARSTTI